MNIYEAIIKRRSIRLFKQIPIEWDILKRLVDAGRLAPSAANLQPVEYIVVDDKELKDALFETLHFASYVKPKRTPPPDKRPTAYIVVLINTEKLKGTKVSGNSDAACACQNILLAALEFNLGGCWLASIDREKIRELLNIPEFCQIYSVIALGYPDEEPLVEEFQGDIKYWLDENNVLHVPKRSIDSILHRNRY
jgi:nitroreductase